jgi:hypothetical protein
VAVFFLGTVMGRGVKQPIKFNHKTHKEQGLECTSCHQYVREQTFAGSPRIEVCLECHEEPITESPEEAKIQQYAQEKKEIPWVPLYRSPKHVFFTHRRHVAVAGIPAKPLETLSMSACMDCHRDTGADNDCLACHN